LNSLLSRKVQDFIRQHEHDDERKLVLQHKNIHGAPVAWVADQIAGRRKAKDKLPAYYRTDNILYPPPVNLEQSSSESTARYKSQITKTALLSGSSTVQTIADLTGGFGIDSFFFSQSFGAVHYVEPNASLLDIARHNHRQLGASGITYHSMTAEEFLSVGDWRSDLIYIDPSRRNSSKQKVFRLADCEPDVVTLQDGIFERTDWLLVKTSPLLDLQQGLSELKHVSAIFVVSVNNDCKEVLFLCNRNALAEPSITAVNIQKECTDEFTFTLPEEKGAEVRYAEPGEYLYEPNASILKAGAFKILASKFDLAKLHSSTHLYTGQQLESSFPGRIFRVTAVVKSDAKAVAQFFPEGKANIITRNYPLGVEEIKKKLKLKDGGDKYLLGFTAPGNNKMLVCAERLK
jgi:hypothetical protein